MPISPPNPSSKDYTRTHATPAEFDASVKAYYTAKSTYNDLFNQLLESEDFEDPSGQHQQEVQHEESIGESPSPAAVPFEDSVLKKLEQRSVQNRDDNKEYKTSKETFRTAKQATTIMPVHPAEEEASHSRGSITDQVMKGDPASSDHPMHDEENDVTSGGSESAAKAHKANPGPALVKDLPPKEGSKEDRQAKAASMNA